MRLEDERESDSVEDRRGGGVGLGQLRGTPGVQAARAQALQQLGAAGPHTETGEDDLTFAGVQAGHDRFALDGVGRQGL